MTSTYTCPTDSKGNVQNPTQFQNLSPIVIGNDRYYPAMSSNPLTGDVRSPLKADTAKDCLTKISSFKDDNIIGAVYDDGGNCYPKGWKTFKTDDKYDNCNEHTNFWIKQTPPGQHNITFLIILIVILAVSLVIAGIYIYKSCPKGSMSVKDRENSPV